MPTVTPDSPEQAKRIALTAAAHTLADIYADENLPLQRWQISMYADLTSYVETRVELATFAKWLDVDIETSAHPGMATVHRATGYKAGVEIRVTYIEQRPPAPQLQMVAGQ